MDSPQPAHVVPPAIRHAIEADLPAIVAIYNASIPGRRATADTSPVTVDQRREWFASFDRASRPLWVAEVAGSVAGWLSLRSFYGRPAYHRTAEVGVYVAPDSQGNGIARALLEHAIHDAPSLGISTLLAFVFGHNEASIALFRKSGFSQWGTLPGIAELDGVERDLLILGWRLTKP